MTLLRSAALLLLWLAVVQAASSADRISDLVESAVSRALSDWRPPALSELGQLRASLEAVEKELHGTRTRLEAVEKELHGTRTRLEAVEQELMRRSREVGPGSCGVCHPLTLASLCQRDAEGTQTDTDKDTGRDPRKEREPEPEPEQEQEPEPVCEDAPTPLSPDAAPHQEPILRACARSCLRLRDRGGAPQDGVYWFTGMPVPVLCDFSHDGGGWTLLLTAATRDGWDVLAVMGRAERSPSLTANYAILRHADAIRDLGTGGRFAYRIEAQAETGPRRWGGVWLAPRAYSFVHESNSQTDVSLVRPFDNWAYKDTGIERRMPWLNTGGNQHAAVLTTSANPSSYWWGTLVTHEAYTTYHHSPWMEQEATHSGTVRYWVREEAF